MCAHLILPSQWCCATVTDLMLPGIAFLVFRVLAPVITLALLLCTARLDLGLSQISSTLRFYVLAVFEEDSFSYIMYNFALIQVHNFKNLRVIESKQSWGISRTQHPNNSMPSAAHFSTTRCV